MNAKIKIILQALFIAAFIFGIGEASLFGQACPNQIPSGNIHTITSTSGTVIITNGGNNEYEFRYTNSNTITITDVVIRNCKVKIYAKGAIRFENVKVYDNAKLAVYAESSVKFPSTSNLWNPFNTPNHNVSVNKNSKFFITAKGNIETYGNTMISVYDDSALRWYTCSNVILDCRRFNAGLCYSGNVPLGNCCEQGEWGVGKNDANDNSVVEIGAKYNVTISSGTFTRRSRARATVFGKRLFWTPVVGPLLIDICTAKNPQSGAYNTWEWGYDQALEIGNSGSGAVSIGTDGTYSTSIGDLLSFIYIFRTGTNMNDFCGYICPQGWSNWDLDLLTSGGQDDVTALAGEEDEDLSIENGIVISEPILENPPDRNISITVSPNPSDGSNIMVELHAEVEYEQLWLELSNIQGQKLDRFAFLRVYGNEVNYKPQQQLSPGVYILKVFDENKILLGTEKLVVQ